MLSDANKLSDLKSEVIGEGGMVRREALRR